VSGGDVMARRLIGTTGVAVSELGFGAASLGNLYREVPDEVARDAVDAAWEVGIRYFDTAPHYGLGLSERRLGAALADRPRSEFVVSTKVGRLLIPSDDPGGLDLENLFHVPTTHVRRHDYSVAGVRRSIEESLDRLGLDRIDIALVHDPDGRSEQRDTLTQALPELVRMREEGLIGAVGVGMNQWEAPLSFILESAPGTVDVVMVAGRWTLLDRSAAPLLAVCEERGVSMLAAAPFNSGLLSKPTPDVTSHYDYGSPDELLLRRAHDLADAARECGAILPQVALQFPLRHPAVVSVVPGLSSAAHVRTSAQWLGEPVDESFWSSAAVG